MTIIKDETIKLLEPVAVAVVRHFMKHRNGEIGGHFKNWNGVWQTVAWVGNGDIEYKCNADCHVRIVDIDVARIDKIDVSPIEPTGEQKIVRVNMVTTNNHTDSDIQRELTLTDTEQDIDKTAEEIGLAVALGFKQAFSYGSDLAGFKGETDISLNVSASYKTQHEKTALRGFNFSGTRKFVEKAGHATIFDRVVRVGPARQHIKVHGLLKFGINVWSYGEFEHTWPSAAIMSANLRGISTGHDFRSDYYRSNFVYNEDVHRDITQPIIAAVEHTHEFENATNEQVDIFSRPVGEV